MIRYLLLRFLLLPLQFFPYSWINGLGNRLGIWAYHLLPKFRKTALSNLALANLELNEEQMIQVAKESFQNLMIACLQYPKLSQEKEIHRIATCENPEAAEQILKTSGIIFFCGHQANWEILFLEGTKRMPGVCIGRPIKNRFLYRWILSIREKYGGKVVPPKNAIKEGMRALKNRAFLGIVGDQGMPDSGFCSPFFGRLAWTSPMPALLSYKMDCPIIVAITKRIEGRYQIHYSDPIYPQPQADIDQEVRRLMMDSLRILEESIQELPGQWLWQHNRWKQQTLDKIRRPFRHDAIAVILPDEQELFESLLPHLSTFREIYPREFIEFFVPEPFAYRVDLSDIEMKIYETPDDLFVRDYRPKLIFNFSKHHGASAHFRSLSALKIVSLSELKRLSGIASNNLSEILKQTIYAGK